MADTKKEHYVPRCYLKNFVNENDRIQVFDKYKMQIRPQRIMDVAMENYFYDIKFTELLKMAEDDEEAKIKKDLMDIVGTDNWNEVLEKLDDKHIEKTFSFIEDIYSKVLQQFIYKSYNGSQWVLDNCSACSEMDEEMAVHMAEILNSHIWVMYLNKTEQPFYTSDNPVANIPHKFDEYMSYGGLQSEGIEIVFPITPKLMLAMYD